MTEVEKTILVNAVKIMVERKEDVFAYLESMPNLTPSEIKSVLKEVGIDYNITIEGMISEKVSELSYECKMAIENGVDVEINGATKHFSYSLEGGDQGNIDDIFNLAYQTGLPQPYHADGEECELFKPNDIFAIYAAQKLNKTSQTTYYNLLKAQISETYFKEEDIDAVAAIKYGEEELVGTYKQTYDSIMEQASMITSYVIGAK